MGRSHGAAATLLIAKAPGLARMLRPRAGISTVNLRNGGWCHVAVEGRIGDDLSSDANRSLGIRTLKLGETWTIQTQGEDIWYRRDADADHPDGRWTAWTHRPCYPNRAETDEESL